MFTRGRYYLAAGCIGLGALLRLTLGIGTPAPVAITIPTSLSCPISSVLGLKLAVCATIPASANVTANVKVQGALVNAKVNGGVQVNTKGSVAKTKGTNSDCGCGTIGLPSLNVDVGATVKGALDALGGNSGCGCGSGKSGGLNIGANVNANVDTNAQIGNQANVQLKVDAKSNTAIKTGGNTGVLLNTNTNLDAALH